MEFKKLPFHLLGVCAERFENIKEDSVFNAQPSPQDDKEIIIHVDDEQELDVALAKHLSLDVSKVPHGFILVYIDHEASKL